MKVWLITVGEPLPIEGAQKRKWRTGYLAELLAGRGHEVTWWTSSVNHFTKEFFCRGNLRVPAGERLTVQFLDGRLYRSNVSLARFVNHREIAREFDRLAPAQDRPDLILCSLPTLELSASAVAYGHRHGVPVLLDVRDLWPDEFVNLLPKSVRFLGPLLFAPLYRDARRALEGADGIVAISQTYLDWGLGFAGREQGRCDAVFTHGYPVTHPCEEEVEAAGGRLRARGIDPARPFFLFLGTFVGSIDLGTVIEAARRLLGEGVTPQFVLCGSGMREAEWKAAAEGVDNVLFPGWVDVPEIAWLSRHAVAGLGAYKAGALMSLTNKIFEYMSAGLPILLSLPGEAARVVVDDGGCGLFYTPGDPASLATAVKRMLDHPDERNQMAAAARALFERDFSAATVYNRMADFLEAVPRLTPPR